VINRYPLLIFDWDGTLADSIARIVESIHVAEAACDLAPQSDKAIRGIIGLSLSEAFCVLYPHVIDDGRLVEHFRASYSDHYLALESEPSLLYPGVADTLAQLRERGHLLAVATGKGRRGLDRVLAGQGWLDFFDVTRCADETAGKPDPLMLHEILAFTGHQPGQALMVGDSVFDMQMAQRAGVDSVAVSYGAQSEAVLREWCPRLVVDDFSELDEWLARCD